MIQPAHSWVFPWEIIPQAQALPSHMDNKHPLEQREWTKSKSPGPRGGWQSSCPPVIVWDELSLSLFSSALKNMLKDTHIFVVGALGPDSSPPCFGCVSGKYIYFFGGEIGLLPAGYLEVSDNCEKRITWSDRFYRMCLM